MGCWRKITIKKYAKHEAQTALKVVAVKIINNSLKTLTIGDNTKFFTGNNELHLVEPTNAQRQLKQSVPIYLLYMLFGIVTFNGLIVGPILTLVNVGIAGSANQHFLRELTQFNLINKSIAPGETAFGLITIPDIGYNPVRLVTASE